VSAETGSMKDRIIQEATRLFTERGYHGMSMREVAEACGVSKPALYYHFQDKDALFLAVLESYLEETARSLEQARTQSDNAAKQLTAMMTALFTQSVEQRAMIRLSPQEQKYLPNEARIRFSEQYHQRFIGQFEAVLRAGMESGEFRPLEPALHTWILLGMAYPFLISANLQESAFDPEALAGEIVTTFLHGVMVA
jgi:AcrR family transcriptional regulator